MQKLHSGSQEIYHIKEHTEPVAPLWHIVQYHDTFDQIKKKILIERLDYFGGHKDKTARSLGLTKNTLYNWMHNFDLIEKYRTRRK